TITKSGLYFANCLLNCLTASVWTNPGIVSFRRCQIDTLLITRVIIRRINDVLGCTSRNSIPIFTNWIYLGCLPGSPALQTITRFPRSFRRYALVDQSSSLPPQSSPQVVTITIVSSHISIDCTKMLVSTPF